MPRRVPRRCRTASATPRRPTCSRRSTSARTTSTRPIRSTRPSATACSPPTSGQTNPRRCGRPGGLLRRGAPRRARADRRVRRRARARPSTGSGRSSTGRPPRCARSTTSAAPASADPLPDQQRMGAHTDYGVVTVLWADRTRRAADPRAPTASGTARCPTPGALLVNLGDLTAEWTNDRWRSTLHRVVPPPAPRAAGAAPQHGVLLRRELGRPHRVRPHVHRRRPAAEVPARHRRRAPDGQADGARAP